MAKIAGRKNDGAWVRTNKDLVALPATDAEALVGALIAHDDDTTLSNAYNGIVNMASVEGIDPTDFPSTLLLWVTQLIRKGIPRQIWEGVTTYDLYNQTTNSQGDRIYVKLIQPFIFAASKYLRSYVTRWLFLNREVKQLNNKIAPTPKGTVAQLRATQPKWELPDDPSEYIARVEKIIERNRLTMANNKSISTVPTARTRRPGARGAARVAASNSE